MLRALDEQGLSDDTIVVLWSDHGYHLGEQNLWGKTTNFELDTRVPLIVRAPQRAGNGHSTAALVELVDLFPTLADLCELPAPSQLEGSSFSRCWTILTPPGNRPRFRNSRVEKSAVTASARRRIATPSGGIWKPTRSPPENCTIMVTRTRRA